MKHGKTEKTRRTWNIVTTDQSPRRILLVFPEKFNRRVEEAGSGDMKIRRRRKEKKKEGEEGEGEGEGEGEKKTMKKTKKKKHRKHDKC